MPKPSMCADSFADPFPQLIPKRVRKVLQRIRERIWSCAESLPVEAAEVRSLPVSRADAEALSYREVSRGEFFGGPGGSWEQRWFRCRIPAAKPAEKGRRHLFWKCQGRGRLIGGESRGPAEDGDGFILRLQEWFRTSGVTYSIGLTLPRLGREVLRWRTRCPDFKCITTRDAE
jgi:hypothetical protein